MSGIFNLESPVVRAVTRVGDLAVLSLMWFVGCIPVVTIGASNTAMYSAIHKVFSQKEGIAAAEFLKCFKSNFRQATLSFLPPGSVGASAAGRVLCHGIPFGAGNRLVQSPTGVSGAQLSRKNAAIHGTFHGWLRIIRLFKSPRQGTTSTGKKKQSCPFEQLCFLGLGDQIKFDLCVGVDDVVGGVGAVN